MLQREGLPVRRRHATRSVDMPGGPKLVHLTFKMDEGPKVKIRNDRLHRQQGDQRRHAEAADEGTTKRRRSGCVHLPTGSSLIGDHGTYQEPKFDEDAEKIVDYYRDHGYITRERRRARAQGHRRFGRQEDAVDRAADSGHRGPRYKVGSFDVAGNTVVKTDYLKPLFKTEAGRVLRREEDPQGPREGARGLRRRRLLRVHRLSRTTSSATTRNPSRARGARRRSTAPKRRGSRPAADRRRDDADAGRASSSSSTASPSPATRRRATTSSGARCGWSRTASSTPRR